MEKSLDDPEIAKYIAEEYEIEFRVDCESPFELSAYYIHDKGHCIGTATVILADWLTELIFKEFEREKNGNSEKSSQEKV